MSDKNTTSPFDDEFARDFIGNVQESAPNTAENAQAPASDSEVPGPEIAAPDTAQNAPETLPDTATPGPQEPALQESPIASTISIPPAPPKAPKAPNPSVPLPLDTPMLKVPPPPPPSMLNPAAVKQAVHDTLRSKRAWAALAVILFLLSLGTLVPVGKIPLLRNLVYAMGFTPEETMRLSLFKALFTWNEHDKIVRGELPDPNALDVFGSAEAAARSAEQVRGGAQAKSGLFNYNAINAQRRRQGQQAEQVAGASGYQEDSDRSDGHNSTIALDNPNAVSNTDANAAKVEDVFFGQEVGGVSRDRRDGYNSVNSLKKLNFPVAGGTSASGAKDWFMEFADRATRQDAELGGLEDELQSRGLLSGMGKTEQVGNTKADRDLYWAWLTGRAARRTPQMVLKKTLAAAGFDGAELPKTVFLASGFSGVGINPDDVVADLSNVKKYMEMDKNCRAAMDVADNATSEKIKTMRDNINNISNYIPHTCGDRNDNKVHFNSAISSAKQTCEEMKKAYSVMAGHCKVIQINIGNCDKEPSSSAAIDDFDKACQQAEAGCAPGPTQQACLADVANRTWQDLTEWSREEVENGIKKDYYKDGDPDKGLSREYFPQVEGSGVWVDENAVD